MPGGLPMEESGQRRGVRPDAEVRLSRGGQMMKNVLLAAGIFACVVGVEMLLVDSAVVVPIDGSGPPRTVTAPDWAPWTLLSVGAATILNFANLGHLRSPAGPVGRGPVGHL
jgi:hypothetical protein